MTHTTLDGTGAVTGTVRAPPDRRCGHDTYPETFVAEGRSVLGVPVAERAVDPALETGGGVPGR